MAALSLNDKPLYVGLLGGVVLAGAIVAGAYYGLISGMNDKIAADQSQIEELDKKIQQGRAAQLKLPQFTAEVDRLQQELDKLRRILPSTKNTEEIIQKIKALVDQADFQLLKMTFPTLSNNKGGDPYAEWPITISLNARYHDLAILFNRLANYSRIMNVEQISLKATGTQTDYTITADFIAKTFVYIEPTSGETKKGEKKPKPGGSGSGKDASE